MAKEKEDRMLNYLIKNPGWHSVDELAIYVGVSKRTIKKKSPFAQWTYIKRKKR
ncbi:hypothetical protein [Sharpea azabuensis]|uniref:hypothetical protein n=1 Tax=Sharpea azabuensis TaxID=322505 RepID=UPI0013DCE6F2|nr:hypothetical protein [Sharpea azabuensis]